MSTTVYSIQNPSSVSTRRSQTRNGNSENDNHTANRRSLSGKFRNFFRKSSPSPNQTSMNAAYPQTAVVRQRSTSPETIVTSTEAPHLKTPHVSWSFGKKKTKIPETTNTSINSKTKTKVSKKNKNKAPAALEISGPIYDSEHQTSIHGANFIPRTPEVAQNGTARINSLSNYETKATKGFRDYMFIEPTRSSHQASISDIDGVMSPPYPVERNYSPSMSHPQLHDTNIEHPYHRDVSPSPPISDMDTYPSLKQQYKTDDPPTATQVIVEKLPLRAQVANFSPIKQQRKLDTISSLSSGQHLVERNPLATQTLNYPLTATESPRLINNSNQWKSESASSLNQADTRFTSSSSMDIDVPKMNSPSWSHGHATNTEIPNRISYQSQAENPYNNTLKINNNHNYPNHTYKNTYDSLPDAEFMHGDTASSKRSSTNNYTKYPGLSAIFQYHLNRPTNPYVEYPPVTTIPQRTKRFDASTTTLDEHEQGQEWSSTYNVPSQPSPSPVQRHDGYIRPMTPRKPSIDKNIHAIYLGTDDARAQAPSPPSPPRTSLYNTNERPVMYRSSTTIYTKDKNNHLDGGELRTFSLQSTDDNDFKKKSTTSLHIDINSEVMPANIPAEYQYYTKPHEKEIIRNDEDEENYVVAYEYTTSPQQQYMYDTQSYPMNRVSYTVNGDRDSNIARTSASFEREQAYDQMTQAYTNMERRQEPLSKLPPVDNVDASLRHYSLKRSASYDGLGILISADAKTGLNPRVRDIEPGSPGYHAGLRKNDRILAINGINVENLEFTDVLALIQQSLNENNLKLTVINESTVF